MGGLKERAQRLAKGVLTPTRKGMEGGAPPAEETAPAKKTPTQEEQEKAIVAKFQEMREQKQQIASKIAELNVEKNEHEMVVKTLTPLDPGRKAWRMIGGVLVERTCGEVLPAVQENLNKLEEVVVGFTKQYDDKEAEINAFMEKYNIRLQGQPPPTAGKASEASEAEPRQGVLAGGM